MKRSRFPKRTAFIAAVALVAGLANAGCGGRCGNFRVDDDEECDGTPNCRADCTEAICGDGNMEGAEECDDGTSNSDTATDACREDCALPSCGDGVTDTGEACDGTCGCDFNCNLTFVCGDGVVTMPCEQCDDGMNNSDTLPDACRTDCTPARCGDGVLDTGEECDEGGLNNDGVADQCRTSCLNAWCGDSVTDTGEECDLGPNNGMGVCTIDCISSACGDGMPDPGEDCDDGAMNSNVVPDACRLSCTFPICGDGVPDPMGHPGDMTPTPEECDDGDIDPMNSCDLMCAWVAACANAMLEPTEECDDGNLTNNDGCDDMCQHEAGTPCAGSIDLDDPGVTTIVGNIHTYTGATAAGAGDFTGNCPGVTPADDVVHHVYFLQRSAVLISTDDAGTDFDTVVYALTDCTDSGTEIGCDDDGGMMAGTSILMPMQEIPAGTTLYIVVDGNGANGNYTLTVSVLPLRVMGDPCDPMGLTDMCDPGLTCVGGTCM